MKGKTMGEHTEQKFKNYALESNLPLKEASVLYNEWETRSGRQQE